MKKEIKIEGIIITHPDKIIYPKEKITKLQVCEYYQEISKYIFPYIKNRVLSLIRCPNGIGDSCFINKHLSKKLEGIEEIKIKNSEGKYEIYHYLSSKKGLISLANYSCIELHTWLSNIENVEIPNSFVFDLDPDENLSLDKIRECAKKIKEILWDLNYRKVYIKTSGSKGYHLMVPLKNVSNFDESKQIAKNIGLALEKYYPDLYTINSSKEKRKGKIFIDYIRNNRGATLVAPYSLRSKSSPCISCPISWDDLSKVSPNEVNIQNFAKYMKPKLWK